MELKVLNFHQLILNTVIFNKINNNGVQTHTDNKFKIQILSAFDGINDEGPDAVYLIPLKLNEKFYTLIS